MARISKRPTPGIHLQLSYALQGGVADHKRNAWMLLPLARRCSNLLVLHLPELAMDASEAAMCLRLLPAGLQSLNLRCPMTIVADASWRRLQALAQLTLLIRHVADLDPNLECSGLSCLPLLLDLQIWANRIHGFSSNTFSMRCNRLAALTKLTFINDPFTLPPCPEALPKLRSRRMVGPFGKAPAWFEKHPISLLSIPSWSVLSNVNVAYLQCHTLRLELTGSGQMILLFKDLLMLPHLDQLVVVHQARGGLCLDGTQEQYTDLLHQISLDLDVITEWYVDDPAQPPGSTPLWWSGCYAMGTLWHANAMGAAQPAVCACVEATSARNNERMAVLPSKYRMHPADDWSSQGQSVCQASLSLELEPSVPGRPIGHQQGFSCAGSPSRTSNHYHIVLSTRVMPHST